MYNKPETYEEAKKIIRECNSDEEYNAKYLNAKKLKAGFIAAAGVGVAATVGLVTGDFSNTTTMLPAVGVVGLTSLLPYFGLKMQMKKVDNGKFFDDKSEEEIMEIANAYVISHNAFEASKGR